MMTLFTKTLLIFLALWTTSIIVLGLFDLQIYFPLNIANAEPIPTHRWQSVRFSCFATLGYLVLKHMIGSGPIYPIAIIDIFVKFLLFFAFILMWKANVGEREWWVFAFYLILSLCLHREARLSRQRALTKYS